MNGNIIIKCYINNYIEKEIFIVTWTVKVKYTRPNTDVDFYSDLGNEERVVSDDNERLISHTKVLSDNELEVISTFVFKDESSKTYYNNDSELQAWKAACNTYNTSNSISKAIIQNEET